MDHQERGQDEEDDREVYQGIGPRPEKAGGWHSSFWHAAMSRRGANCTRSDLFERRRWLMDEWEEYVGRHADSARH